VGYFAQHQLDELHEDWTPYDYMAKLMPEATMAQRRAKLGAVGFGAKLADSRCDTLSGGEKARLLFLLATFHGPHVLVLDEPTNHLDIDSREALILAINDYEGAVILISHDRHIIETCADRLWLVSGGTVASYDGDMDDYTRLVLSQARMARRGQPLPEAPAPTPVAPPRQRMSPDTLRRSLGDLENRMSQTRGKISVLDEALADHTIYAEEPRKAADFSKLRARLAGELDALETRWLELQEGTAG
jgi:ATP-binding cassette subfamily F protein 3